MSLKLNSLEGRKPNPNINMRTHRHVLLTSSYDDARDLVPMLGTDWFMAFDSRVVIGAVPPFRFKFTKTTHDNRKRTKLANGGLSAWSYLNPVVAVYALEVSFKYLQSRASHSFITDIGRCRVLDHTSELTNVFVNALLIAYTILP